MKSIRKKNLIIGTSVILLIGVGLYSLRFLDSSGERVLKTCLFDSPVKCGYVDFTERKILEEVNILNISKKNAKERFELSLQANENRFAELIKVSEQRELTSEERENKTYNEIVIPYYQRALHALEKMED